MKLSWSSTLDFGKYKGRTIADVFIACEDYTYLAWLVDSVEGLELDADMEAIIRAKAKVTVTDEYDDMSWGDFET